MGGLTDIFATWEKRGYLSMERRKSSDYITGGKAGRDANGLHYGKDIGCNVSVFYPQYGFKFLNEA